MLPLSALVLYNTLKLFAKLSSFVFTVSVGLDSFRLSEVHVNNFVELRGKVRLTMLYLRETVSKK